MGVRLRPKPLPPPSTPPRGPFRRARGVTGRAYRSRGFGVFSVLLVVAIVLAGVWLAVGGREDAAPPRAATPPPPAPSSTVAPPSTVTGDGGCPGMPFEDQSLPADAPAAVWRPVGHSAGAAAAPSLAGIGPVADEAGVIRCYVRTPVGALFAAATFLARVSDPATIEAALLDLTVDGEGQQRLWLLYGFAPDAVFGGGGYAIAGYTFLASGLDTVTVSVALRAGNGGLAGVPLTLVWDEGTWLVRLPDDGDLTARSQLLPGLNGYTPWQAR